MITGRIRNTFVYCRFVGLYKNWKWSFPTCEVRAINWHAFPLLEYWCTQSLLVRPIAFIHIGDRSYRYTLLCLPHPNCLAVRMLCLKEGLNLLFLWELLSVIFVQLGSSNSWTILQEFFLLAVSKKENATKSSLLWWLVAISIGISDQ